MNTIADIFKWFAEHWTDILAGFGGAVLFASIIVGLTPTTKDDTFLRKIINAFDKLSFLQTKENKEFIEAGKKHLKDEDDK